MNKNSKEQNAETSVNKQLNGTEHDIVAETNHIVNNEQSHETSGKISRETIVDYGDKKDDEIVEVTKVDEKNINIVKKSIDDSDKKEKEKKIAKKNKNIISIILGVVILFFTGLFVVFSLYGAGGDIKISLENETLSVKATLCDVNLSFSNIDTVKLQQDITYGKRTNGLGNKRMNTGAFNNGQFGDYTCACYTSSNTFIVIKSKSGDYVVLNQKTVAETEQLYQNILAKLNK